jgi:hypothetical protein
VESLQNAGCKTIGLETMPDSPYNVGFYTCFGFRPWFPTFLLHKNVEQPPQTPSFALFSQQDNNALSTLTQISQAAWSGLDYASEAESARQYGWGETLLIGWPQTWAFAVVRTVPKREESDEAMAEVLALVVHPQARQRLAEALQAVETFAVDQNAPQINLCVNGVDGQTLQRTLDYGFRVDRVRLRMVYESEYVCPAGVDLSGWVM